VCNKGNFYGGLALIMDDCTALWGGFVLQLGDLRAMTLKQTISQPNIGENFHISLFSSVLFCFVVGEIEGRVQ
jgi:hypothetical protein